MNRTTRALDFIAHQQTNDGGFIGLAATTTDFHETLPRPTIFYSALIMLCLQDIAGSGSITKAAAEYLLQNRSDTWTWNYWQRDCAENANEPYPDDVDDTAMALAALQSYNSELINGSVQGYLAQILVAQEEAAGGPYRTWIHDDPKWHDIDIAVNANIGFCLKLLGVELPQLKEYIQGALADQALMSSYYVGDIPTIYFISRYLAGSEVPALRHAIERAATSAASRTNPLFVAMLLSSAIEAQANRSLCAQLRRRLLALATDDHWAAAALYFEPPDTETHAPRYAGSAALSTAFALEALALSNNSKQALLQPVAKRLTPQTRLALDLPQTQLPADLKRLYQSSFKNIVEHDVDQQITSIADTVARACQIHLPQQLLVNLNQASLHGWMAYTIYDDILDGDATPELLSMANFALRQSQQYFSAALPTDAAFHTLVQQTLDTVDGANTWEALHARGRVSDRQVTIEKLPDYGNHAQLWQRSAGHLLAMRGTLLAAGNPLQGRAQQQYSRFFKHFIIARQLNDDAHDWESDLAGGQLSAVVSHLLKDYFDSRGSLTIDLEQQLRDLQIHFWEVSVVEICSLIEHHVMLAERALKACAAIHMPSELLSWLEPLRLATARVHRERNEAKKFMQAYGASKP